MRKALVGLAAAVTLTGCGSGNDSTEREGTLEASDRSPSASASGSTAEKEALSDEARE